nr:MAG TPA: hypothetical protein [Caudoviricetes sp.]
MERSISIKQTSLSISTAYDYVGSACFANQHLLST